MSSKEEQERDLKRLKELESYLKRTDLTEEQRLKAADEGLDIAYKYDALNVQRKARLHTLDLLKGLQEIAAKDPTDAEDKKMRDEAKEKLAYYENLLFPPGKLPN
jgi:hypothetical protein